MRYTVTVGIPAHNEAANINRLLDAILFQKGENFVLKRVIVVGDGCTDATETIVRAAAVRDARIEWLADGKHRGKAYRLNQIYRLNQSDVLVTFDADVFPEHHHVIGEMTKRLFSGDVLAAVAGNAQPVPATTAVEYFAVAQMELWYEVRKDYMGGDNIYNSSGCAYAFKKAFVETLELPSHTINDQETIYAAVKDAGQAFALAKQARVLFRAPSTWQEWRAHNNRLSTDYQGCSCEKWRIPISWRHKMSGLWRCARRAPIAAMSGLLAHFVFEILFRQLWVGNDSLAWGAWESLPSTKSFPLKK